MIVRLTSGRTYEDRSLGLELEDAEDLIYDQLAPSKIEMDEAD